MKRINFIRVSLFLMCINLLVFPHPRGVEKDMVHIPAGHFLMGKDGQAGANYGPARSVEVNAFLMDKHEVTNAEYKQFCLETGHRFPEFWNTALFRSGEAFPSFPVVGISHADARDFAVWAGKRLATEAEWEYAARGGLKDKDFPNGESWTKKKVKNSVGDWQNLIDPVMQSEPNGYGLYDMGGNVWEWVSDRYAPNYVGAGTKNPTGPEAGNIGVVRGGSWHSGTMCKKVYFRKGLPRNWTDFAVGFRCVKDIHG